MNGGKRVAALLGVMVFVGLGAFGASRAQQPPDRPAARLPDKKVLRAKIVALRTEIELLEMEHETVRKRLVADMPKELEATRKIEREMKRRSKELAQELAETRAILAKKSKDERAELINKATEEFGIERHQGEDDVAFLCRADFEGAMRQFYQNEGVDLRTFRLEKAAFFQKTRELNEKRLELADCEAEYKATK